jgi:DNA-directed RNA polymerase subunit RPC12/RpoP
MKPYKDIYRCYDCDHLFDEPYNYMLCPNCYSVWILIDYEKGE